MNGREASDIARFVLIELTKGIAERAFTAIHPHFVRFIPNFISQ
jgi:hypothetical protein